MNEILLTIIGALVTRLSWKVEWTLSDHEARIRANENERLLRAGRKQIVI